MQLSCDPTAASRQLGHVCIADEHYVASTLSAYNASDSVDGIGALTFTDWETLTGWHPRTFFPDANALKTVALFRTTLHNVGRAPASARARVLPV
jgi:hypothetical protein